MNPGVAKLHQNVICSVVFLTNMASNGTPAFYQYVLCLSQNELSIVSEEKHFYRLHLRSGARTAFRS